MSVGPRRRRDPFDQAIKMVVTADSTGRRRVARTGRRARRRTNYFFFFLAFFAVVFFAFFAFLAMGPSINRSKKIIKARAP
ncbi:hypothetical protein AAFX91_22390 [Bradyrhizobium sp. 31Argb]|uniref:hypothetical protein n=1 Tax=unclassified Bradyrhizobium TaxID=2631580 RepID=UPI0013EEE429|nr:MULTISPECIES: hypothetical protein [unclassified Bradyrhizobium]